MLKAKIQEDIRTSMFARDELKTSTLRLLMSSLKNYEIEKGLNYEAIDEDVLTIVSREIKKRRESIEMFQKGGRQELVDKEQKELEQLQRYLPEQLSEDEVKKLVDDAISQVGAKSIQDMGKVMGILSTQIKGKADGSMVSTIVREKLSQ